MIIQHVCMKFIFLSQWLPTPVPWYSIFHKNALVCHKKIPWCATKNYIGVPKYISGCAKKTPWCTTKQYPNMLLKHPNANKVNKNSIVYPKKYPNKPQKTTRCAI